MGSIFAWVGDAFLRTRSGLTALLFCIACVSTGAWAQTPGERVEGQIKVQYGDFVTLPAGSWTVVDSWRLASDASWYLTLLQNNDPQAVIPFFQIRVNPQSARWIKSLCDDDPNKSWKFLQYSHGTQSSDLLSKCSRVIRMGSSFSEFADWAAAGNDVWFQDTAQRLKNLNADLSYEIVGTESQIAHLNSYQIQLYAFIRINALGASQGAIQSARYQSTEHPVMGTLRTWLDDLLAANAASFLDGKVSRVAALSRSITGDSAASGSAATQGSQASAIPKEGGNAPEMWQWALGLNTRDAYQKFLARYPGSAYAYQAAQRIEELYTNAVSRPQVPDVSSFALDVALLKIDEIQAAGRGKDVVLDYRDIYAAETDLLEGRFERALPYIKSTAVRGDAYAIGLLGLAFADAKGVDQDDAQAIKLFSLAADFGDARSKEWLAQRAMLAPLEPSVTAQAQQREAQRALDERNRKEQERLLAENTAKEQQRLAELAKQQQQREAEAVRQKEQQRLAEAARLQALALASQKSTASSVEREVFANRKALVIGNDSYKSVSRLLNAREDARSMAAGLARVGYQVTLKTDLDMQGMKSAIRSFKAQIEGGDEVAIFYAGHGVQLANTNFLLPVDIAGESEDQIKDDAIPLQRLLDDIADKRAKFTLAMIDACRDNPFKATNGRSMGGSRGLSPTTAATGQMIVFSAGTGQQALDKLGPNDKDKNGVFTRVFLRQIDTPGVSIDRLVRSVRTEVVGLAKSVGHDQVPAIYDQVVGEYYFRK